MSNYIYNPESGELYHYGVKGMKWGVRRARGYAGPGLYVGNKRKIAGYKRDLQRLDNGEHLSVGLTKKRQAAFDARDRKALEKGIAKAEAKERDKTERRAKKAESKAHKKLEKASNSYFRARDFEKVGDKKASEAASRNAEKNIKSAKKILDKVGSTRSDNLFGMAQTQNGYEYWQKYGYETR